MVTIIENNLRSLACLFGFGSWIAITGLWIELPVLIQRSPEGWRLASHLTIMIQAANLGPLLYYFLRKYRLIGEAMAIHWQMLIGSAACLLLIFGWQLTVSIAGQQRSIPLLLATFGLALVDCTSSVTFLPFMARFKPQYLVPYLVGEGMHQRLKQTE